MPIPFRPGQFAMIVLLNLLAVRVFSEDAPAPHKPAVLFATGYCDGPSLPDATLFDRLQAAGFEIGYAPQEELDEARLSKFNAVVLLGTMKTDNFALNDKVKRFHAALANFSAKGGGIFVNLRGGESPYGILSAIDFMKLHGCTPLMQAIKEPASRTPGTLRGFPFAFADDVTAHELTKDVHGLWYPIELGKNIAEPWTHPFRVDDTWTVLVRGARQSSTEYAPTNIASVDQAADKAAISARVPLFAVKTENNGASRLAVTGIHTSFTFCCGFRDALESVVMERGLLGKKSDGWTLYFNTLRWLAEPSVKSGTLGGFVTTQDLRNAIQKIAPPLPPIDLKTIAPERPLVKGLWGARSTFSTGKNSVEEMAQAAKAAGLDYIVFAEDFAALKTKGPAIIEEACKKASSADFTAVAGFTIQDEGGNYWLYAKSPLVLPGKELLMPDGAKFSSFYDKQIWASPLRFWLPYQYPGPGMVGASFKHSQGGMQYWDYRDYTAVAIYTYENGKLIDDLSREYPLLQQNAQSLAPISVSLVNSVDELKDAAKPGLPLTYIASGKGDALVKRINLLGSYMDEPHTFVSSGPVLNQWRLTRGAGMYPFNAGYFNAGYYRFHAGLHATSAVGIREVRIVDGGKRFRRFQYNGEKDVAIDLPLVHDRQHHLVAYVTDVQDKVAISGEIWDRNHLYQDFYCSDHNNHLLVGVLPTPDGKSAQFESGCMTMKGSYFFMQLSEWFTGFPGQDPNVGFDGSVSGGADLNSVLSMQTEPAWDDALNAHDSMTVSSVDLCVRDRVAAYKYRDGRRGVWMAWESILPTVPTECFDLTERHTALAPVTDSRTNFRETEIMLTFKRDVALKPDAPARLYVGWIIPRASRAICIRESDRVLSFEWDENKNAHAADLHGSLVPGNYISCYGSPLGAVHYFPMKNTRLEYEIQQAPNKGRVDLYVPFEKRAFKKGDTISFSLLVVSNRMDDNKSNLMAEEVGSKYGLFGAPTTRVEMSNGSLQELKLYARMEAQDGYVSGILRDNNLPAPLPVRVSGLNDRWTAQLLDKRTGQHRPIAMLDGEARTNLPKNGEQEFFIGHPFICDDPGVALTAVESGDGGWLLDIHNPTDAAKKVTVTRSREFPIDGVDVFTVDLPAGASVLRTFNAPLAAAPAPDAKATLAGHWKLDDGAGDKAADSSLNAAAGKLIDAPQWIEAAGGKALTFDGAKTSVELPQTPALNSLQDGDYSIAAWFKPGGNPAPDSDYTHSGYGIVMKVGNHIGLGYLNNHCFMMSHWLSNDANAAAFSARPSPPGEFYHVVGIVNKTRGETKIYVNGVLAGSNTFPANSKARDYSGKSWEIGAACHFGDDRIWPAKGAIRDVRLYSGVLSDAEIKALNEAGKQ